jgi:DNA mismatch repair protein MutL
MPDIIRLLPDALANQIAAGEVVQRPASVVKELLENSIDAGSNKIQLIIKDAGKTLIQVVDNGKGMSDTDARLCFERHATSKISSTDDLFAIRTFGFRGEALASIAAVAQVEMKTRRTEDEIGTLIRIEGSELKVQEPVNTPVGTNFSVKNLFFNVPARRNFLKSNPVEMRHILDEFHRVALAYPSIGFSLYQNDMEIFNMPSEKLSRRIISLFGQNYKEQLIPCQEETDLVKITGYIGKPENAKRTRGDQFFFVNNRFIKNNYLHHAVVHAFDNLLPDDTFPFYVLFIEIDPKHIDVNVHPTKTEIKFDDEKTIYAIIRAAVKKALATHNIAPPLDFEQDINFSLGQTSSGFQSFPSNRDYEPDRGNDSFKSVRFPSSSNPLEGKNRDNWEQLYQSFENEEKPKTFETIRLESAVNTKSEERNVSLNKDLLYNENQSTFQLHQKYIVTQVKSGMLVVDQQAAHERILYEKYLNMLQNKFGASQQFLFPLKIELSHSDFALVMEMEEEIKSLGFVFSVFGNNTIVVNGIPADISSGNEKDLFEGLIEQFKNNRDELSIDRKENLARSLAKRASLKPGTRLTLLEMNTLIDQLFACKNPNYAPNGNHTIVLLDMNRIEKFFNKNQF